MQIIYQGKSLETSAAFLAAFLAEKGISPANAVVEYRGEILDPGALEAARLEEGAEINVYRIVSGG